MTRALRASPAAITHADYFQAVRSYVTGPGHGHVQRALTAQQAFLQPDRMTIILEKHGEFYHPARLAIDGPGEAAALVLNVAVSPAGCEWMASEMEALHRVTERMPRGCLPAVYGHARVPGADQSTFGMFLADWFNDYFEFHLSMDPRQGSLSMVVWDTLGAPFFLSAQQQAAVYQQSAYLLTRAYDPVSTRQIYPWHHASGDFVLRARGPSIDLRLITVRQYAPTLTVAEGSLDEEERLMSLMVFFLNLTIRNRLDRLDGTGDPVWAGSLAVPATVAGVYLALDEHWGRRLAGLMAVYGLAELIDALGAVADRYRLMPMEKDLVHANLAAHAELLHETLGKARHG